VIAFGPAAGAREAGTSSSQHGAASNALQELREELQEERRRCLEQFERHGPFGDFDSLAETARSISWHNSRESSGERTVGSVLRYGDLRIVRR
jgi:hypothetical protein